MDSELPRQRADISAKYDYLYQILARIMRLVIGAGAIEKAEKYAYLKFYMRAAWAVTFKLSAEGNLHAPEAEWIRRCDEFNASAATWLEKGTEVHGTEAKWEQAMTRTVTTRILRHLPADCEAIVDLGCGWGHRMFDLWRAGGPPHARYYGGDRPPASREIIEVVAGMHPGMDVRPFVFDFLQPDFAAIDGAPRRIGVYSVHAIEQVEHLGGGIFDALIARFPAAEITGVHLEPFGFQIGDDDPSQWERDRSAATRKHYNMDLYRQVTQHPKLKVLAVDTGLLDRADGNSTSLLVWRYVPERA